jgi:hypothetical protein
MKTVHVKIGRSIVALEKHYPAREEGMEVIKQLLENILKSLLFFVVVYSCCILWGTYRLEIQSGLRTAQNLIFG